MIFCAKNSVVIVNFGPLKWNISGICHQNSTLRVSEKSLHSGQADRVVIFHEKHKGEPQNHYLCKK